MRLPMNTKTPQAWGLWLGALIALTACSAPPVEVEPDEKPQAIADLAFLVGNWDLDTWFVGQDGTREPGKAQLSGRASLGGMGLELRATYPTDDGSPPFHSTTTYAFNRRLSSWIGAGINSLGNAKQYQVELVEGEVIVQQSGMLFEGRSGINRLTYSDISSDGFKLTHEHSPDGGSTWEAPKFGYIAKRVATGR